MKLFKNILQSIDDKKRKKLTLNQAIEKYGIDDVNFSYYIKHQELSEDIIHKYFDRFSRYDLLYAQQLSEDFIDKHYDQLYLLDIIIYQKISEDFIERHIVDVSNQQWQDIAKYQVLSEEFIEKHIEKFDISILLQYQKLSDTFYEKHYKEAFNVFLYQFQILSEEFIERHCQRFDSYAWHYISKYQKMSEPFIEKYADKVDWYYISEYQTLSEEFIEKHADKVSWNSIFIHQKLSKSFIEKYVDKPSSFAFILLNHKVTKDFLKKHTLKLKDSEYSLFEAWTINKRIFYDNRSERKKLKEMKAYAKKWNLEFNKVHKVLYAYRDHDNFDRGYWNKTFYYDELKYYRDWRCNLDKKDEASFGFGIWPKGNTKVAVTVNSWGIAINNIDGKARVKGFDLLEKNLWVRQ